MKLDGRGLAQRAAQPLRPGAAEHHLAALDAHAADGTAWQQGLVARNDIRPWPSPGPTPPATSLQAGNAAQPGCRRLQPPAAGRSMPVDLTEPPVADTSPGDIVPLLAAPAASAPNWSARRPGGCHRPRSRPGLRRAGGPRSGCRPPRCMRTTATASARTWHGFAVGVEWQLFDGGLLRYQADAARAGPGRPANARPTPER